MPLYRYKALQGDAPAAGTVAAATSLEARRLLRAKGLLVIRLQKERTPLFPSHPFRDRRRLALFCREWASLLAAGLPMTESLSLLESQENRRAALILSRIRSGIETGQSLTAAFRESGAFPAFFLAMLAIGERSGTLPEELLSLSDYYEKEQKFLHDLRGALSYPLFILFFSLLVCAVILTIVLPAFAALFEAIGAPLPFPAKAALSLGLFLKEMGPFLAALLPAAGCGLSLLRRTPRGRLLIDTLLLRSIFLRRLLLIRFCRALAALLQSGSPLSEALESAAAVTGNSRAEEAVLSVSAAVQQGGSFPAALGKSGFTLPLLTHMTAAGMESGELPRFLLHAARLMTSDAENRLARYKSAAEPLLISITGLLTAALVLSVMIPLFSAVTSGLGRALP